MNPSLRDLAIELVGMSPPVAQLGLYITKAIVFARYGAIAVTSCENGSMEFLVRFPR